MAEARRAGLRVQIDGERLVVRGPRRAESIARRLLAAKPAVLEALRHDPASDYLSLTRSPLVARVRAAWPWIAEHRPDLFRRICDADYAGDVERLRHVMEEASRAYELRNLGGVRVHSKVLDVGVWLAPDDQVA